MFSKIDCKFHQAHIYNGLQSNFNKLAFVDEWNITTFHLLTTWANGNFVVNAAWDLSQ